MGSKSRGAAMERELVNAFFDAGWTPLRLPTSGSGTERELPDLQAAVDGYVVVIELKYTGEDRVYVDREKVEGLVAYAEAYGATPYLCARWKYDPTFYAVTPAQCYQTDGGQYRLHKDDRDDMLELPPFDA